MLTSKKRVFFFQCKFFFNDLLVFSGHRFVCVRVLGLLELGFQTVASCHILEAESSRRAASVLATHDKFCFVFKASKLQRNKPANPEILVVIGITDCKEEKTKPTYLS